MSPPDAQVIRDAATLILLRRRNGTPHVLMGQRGAGAAFMPSKFVFPGGGLDPDDVALGNILPIDPEAERRLAAESDPALGRGLAVAAIRELWEETGLALGRPDPSAAKLAVGTSGTLRSMFQRGLRPDATCLTLVFRAITPPGRPRRFDARFFLADADAVHGDPDDFSGACGELSCLHWVELSDARSLPLPFITEVVLAEVAAAASGRTGGSSALPFFKHDAAGAHISLI